MAKDKLKGSGTLTVKETIKVQKDAGTKETETVTAEGVSLEEFKGLESAVAEMEKGLDELKTEVKEIEPANGEEDLEALNKKCETLEKAVAGLAKKTATDIKRLTALVEKALEAAGAKKDKPKLEKVRPVLKGVDRQFTVDVEDPKTGVKSRVTKEIKLDQFRDPRSPATLVLIEKALDPDNPMTDLLCELVIRNVGFLKHISSEPIEA